MSDQQGDRWSCPLVCKEARGLKTPPKRRYAIGGRQPVGVGLDGGLDLLESTLEFISQRFVFGIDFEDHRFAIRAGT